jgi:hypothetical protein
MVESPEVPTGRLTSVERDWDYQAGWVRAPLREIVFNDRLTKQARLVWLWLASVPTDTSHVSWGECETMLSCGTKARRSCIAQLIQEGFVTIHNNGRVQMHDPYAVYQSKREEVLNEMRDEWKAQEPVLNVDTTIKQAYDITVIEKKIDKEINKNKTTEPPAEDKPKPRPVNRDSLEDIISAWNDCCPDSYSKIRILSTKQQECIAKHMKNLGLGKNDLRTFICSVCSGLAKSQFWSSQVAPHGRNFKAVFGYGSPNDIKMRNVEELYMAGQEIAPADESEQARKFTIEEQDFIDAYNYSKMNYTNNKSRGETSEAERWLDHMNAAKDELSKFGIDVEEL